jgi:hypothetical protein
MLYWTKKNLDSWLCHTHKNVGSGQRATCNMVAYRRLAQKGWRPDSLSKPFLSGTPPPEHPLNVGPEIDSLTQDM